MGALQFNRWKPNRWDLLTLCILAVLVRWPWLGVLAFLLGDELHSLAGRVISPSYVPATSSPAEVFQFRRGASVSSPS
jgi:hypothetical protein